MSETSNLQNIRKLVERAHAAHKLYQVMTKRLEVEQPNGRRSALSALQEAACGNYADAAMKVFEAIPEDADAYLAQAEFIAAHFDYLKDERENVICAEYEQIIAQWPHLAV